MRKICLALLFFCLSSTPAFATKYVIVNFAQMNTLDWTAADSQWDGIIKPQIETQLVAMRTALTPTTPTADTPQLGWSTLMEYMNFPLDTPGPNAPYVVKTKRILEVAKDLNFPVFLPLNGFQWWDQLPELYNWWDPDGTHTDPAFFARQSNPAEFKARFIRGYNPDNRANVLWQGVGMPMQLNYRNWGGGGFRLAPPPNLNSPVYLSIQHARLQAIIQEIRKDPRPDLFLGITIGTEVSTNASVLPRDEFRSYGGPDKVEVVRDYLENNARLATRLGIPKDLIYTHVLGEQPPGDPHYSGIASAAFNLYSNPGTSLYGFADNPLRSSVWEKTLNQFGNPSWGAVEYTSDVTTAGLTTTLATANLVDIYNWDGISPSAISAIKTVLARKMPNDTCQMTHVSTHIQPGIVARLDNPDVSEPNLPHGVYTKFTETDCADGHKEYSQPEAFYIPVPTPIDTTPVWVKLILRIFNF